MFADNSFFDVSFAIATSVTSLSLSIDSALLTALEFTDKLFEKFSSVIFAVILTLESPDDLVVNLYTSTLAKPALSESELVYDDFSILLFIVTFLAATLPPKLILELFSIVDSAFAPEPRTKVTSAFNMSTAVFDTSFKSIPKLFTTSCFPSTSILLSPVILAVKFITFKPIAPNDADDDETFAVLFNFETIEISFALCNFALETAVVCAFISAVKLETAPDMTDTSAFSDNTSAFISAALLLLEELTPDLIFVLVEDTSKLSLSIPALNLAFT